MTTQTANPTISRTELAAALQGPNPPVLFEALPVPYWTEGHLPSAIALPPEELTPRLAALALDRAKPIVVYCASATCANSHQVATKMSQLGYADVRVYEGGKADWVEAGLPLGR
jgi:rhodanese-related sulfurtransferase